MTAPAPHRWQFSRSGGFDQAKLETAADFANLEHLDQKLWAALACPVKGLEFDERTLALVDTDKDGRVRAPEIVGAVQWCEDHLKDLAALKTGSDALPLASIRDDTASGKAILASARQILKDLGKAAALEITLADVADTARIFASANKGSASKLNNEALRSLEAGRDPIFTSMVMGRGAGDSAKQTAATAYQVAKQSRPSEATVELIDKQMRANMAAEKVKTETPFPGFGSGKLGAWLDENGLKARGAFVRALDTKGARAGGVPDIGEVRYANTDPRLRTTPTGSSGLFMARMRPELEAAGVDSLHSNYPATILGSKADRGGLAGSVPFHVIAPDLHRQLLAAGEPRFFANNPAQLVMTNMPTGISKTQTVTPEVVDRVSEFFRKYPKGFAYAGGVPALGALASQDQYEGQ